MTITEEKISPALVKNKKSKSEIKTKFLIKTIIIFIVFLFILATAGIYLGGWKSQPARALSRVIFYPAAYVNGQVIYVHDYLDDLNALERYYLRQGTAFEADDLKQQVIDSLTEKKVLEQLALNADIQVSDEELKQQLDYLSASKEGGENPADLIKELYNWMPEQYLEKVLQPLMLAQKLEENYYQTVSQSADLKEALAGYLAEIKDNPARFEEIASSINDDDTGLAGGDLGWFTIGDTVPEFELQLLEMSVGEVSEVVETRYGLHIIKLKDKVVSEDGTVNFNAAHVFKARTDNFGDYLDEQIKKAKVISLIK